MLVTFSGLDGAGKTTQIELFTQYLEETKCNFKKLSMYDDISSSAFVRRMFRNKRAKITYATSERNYRYDKNRREKDIVLLRKIAYFVDLLILIFKQLYYQKLKRKTIVMDRYLYDSLANLSDTNSNHYINIISKLIPKPNLAIFLDAEPHVAFQRKPEYPPEFYSERRDAYIQLFENVSSGTIVKSDRISTTQDEIRRLFKSVKAGSRMGADKFSPYVDLVTRSFLNGQKELKIFEGFRFDDLLLTLKKNRVTVRWLNAMRPLLDEKFKNEINSILKSEELRRAKTLELTGKVTEEFERRRLKFLVIKTLDNYPDLGHDVDMYTNAPIDEVDDIFINTFKAKLETPSLPEKIAQKRNYRIDDAVTFELHCSKLGELGEEMFLAKDLISNYEKINIEGIVTYIPRVEYRILMVVLQRIYRHFNIRICDLFNTINLIKNDSIDWETLKNISLKYGVWEGVLLYLSYIYKTALYYNIDLNIKNYLELKTWPPYIQDRNMHYRFPLLSTGINIYSKKVISDILHLNINSLARLPLFIPLSCLHYVSVKLYGKSHIW